MALSSSLTKIGVTGNLVNLLTNYVSDCHQRVVLNGQESGKKINVGVPRGLFWALNCTITTLMIFFLFMLLEIANYACDNSPFTAAPTIPKVISNLEEDAKNLLSWIKYNGLSANPDKFHLVLSDPNENLTMNVDSFDIPNSLCQCLLGVKIDSKLAFESHIDCICTTASQKLHALSRIGNYMTFEQRKVIMISFILSQFGYCPLVWMLHSRKLNNRINRIHCRALRIVYQDRKFSFDELLAKDKSFNIHERNIQTLCIELYKVAY